MRSFVHASVTVCIKQSPLSITRQNFPGLAHQREREPSLQTALKKTGRALLLGALRLAQVGFVAEQSARLGMSGAVKLISSVSRKFIVRMDREQLLVVATHIRALAR